VQGYHYDLQPYSEERKKILKAINRSANGFRLHILDFEEVIQHLEDAEGQTPGSSVSAAAKA
jgi:hypothetical protein